MAEEFVRDALERQGWQILRQNFRVKHSEIDLIAQKSKTIIFVEVKYRHASTRPRIYESIIGFRKRQSIRFGARAFLHRFHPDTGFTYRYDLALVSADGKISYQVSFME